MLESRDSGIPSRFFLTGFPDVVTRQTAQADTELIIKGFSAAICGYELFVTVGLQRIVESINRKGGR